MICPLNGKVMGEIFCHDGSSGVYGNVSRDGLCTNNHALRTDDGNTETAQNEGEKKRPERKYSSLVRDVWTDCHSPHALGAMP